MVLALAWDTATTVMSLALVKFEQNGQLTVLDRRTGDGLTSHSALLPPLVHQTLDDCGFEVNDLDFFAVGRGPGSFTGLRSGLSLAKGLGFGANKPVLGLSSLLAIASLYPTPALVAPLIDARHQELFTALYRVAGPDQEPQQLSDILVVKPKDLFKILKNIAKSSEDIKLLGPALAFVPSLISGFSLGPDSPPPAEALASLAVRRFRLGLNADCPVVPLYGRAPDIFATWKPPKRLKS
jgi:tRNA threonylcarbamoyladenosine biosynthesis protein TsaB